jgi:putative N6-adenine-specific DNA methylase
MSTSYEIFAAVTPGLEEALASELAECLPTVPTQVRRGGVTCRGTQEVLWTISVHSRLAETVRVRVGRFKARQFAELESGLGRIPWSAYLPRQASVTVQVTARKSALYHSGAIAERVAKALDRPVVAPDEAQFRLWVRIVKDQATVSMDAGGGLLHRRGWRQAVGRAPIRETLAAACLRLAKVAPGQALWDPFCGSGTIPIEGALARAAAPCQTDRRFAFQDWPTFQSDAYEAWRAEAVTERAPLEPLFFGTERSEETLVGAKANAERAGVDEACRWMSGDFIAHLDAIPKGAAVVSNLPYGKRLGGGAPLERLFGRFGECLAQRPDLGPVVVLVGKRPFERATGLRWETIGTFGNRGTPTRLLRLKR